MRRSEAGPGPEASVSDAGQRSRRATALGWLLRLGVGYPWGWLASVYVVWIVAWMALGRRPRPLLDDPKHLGGWVDPPYSASVYLFLLAFPILGASIAAALFLGFSRTVSWSVASRWLAALLISWIACVGFVRADPGHILAWYFD